MAPTTRRLDRRIQGGIKRQFPEGIDVPLPEGTSPANHRGPARPPISPLLSVQPGWETYPGYPGESRPRLPHSKLGLPPDNRCDRCRRGNKLNPLVKPSTRIRRDIGVKLGGGVFWERDSFCGAYWGLVPYRPAILPLSFEPPSPGSPAARDQGVVRNHPILWFELAGDFSNNTPT
jgi:hypothetical protein